MKLCNLARLKGLSSLPDHSSLALRNMQLCGVEMLLATGTTTSWEYLYFFRKVSGGLALLEGTFLGSLKILQEKIWLLGGIKWERLCLSAELMLIRGHKEENLGSLAQKLLKRSEKH
mmetsp:Transcript_24095/g.18382  ORF Transcript_24095/g.18382 Transcript_24095/m.18382 type:complete len:117 (-) Transcript_24095:653-1003(-)